MMKQYPLCKDSGIEWIGKIPREWKIVKAKSGLKRVKSIANQDNPIILSLTSNGIVKRDISNNEGQIAASYHDYNQVKKGDLLLNPMDLVSNAFASVSNIEGVISQAYFNLRSLKGYHNKYYEYYFKLQYWGLTFFAHGRGVSFDNRWTLNSQTLMNYLIPFPSFFEQKQIATFLDHKTQLIDKLIEKTKKKIELLKEKRTALINHCVTKGLNPNVEIKDSSVKWIGDITKHWEVIKLKYLAEVYSSTVDRHTYNDERQVSVCHYPDVYNNEFINEDIGLHKGSCSNVEFERFQLKEGLVIITKDSESPDDIGIPCYVETNLNNVVCGYHLSIIGKNKNYIKSKFLFRFIQSDIVRCHFEVHSKGITRYSLGKAIIENLFVNLPPLSEQNQIVKYLDEQTHKIDTIIEKETQRIELLKEYCQSLISEVVTGKIDVRDEIEV